MLAGACDHLLGDKKDLFLLPFHQCLLQGKRGARSTPLDMVHQGVFAHLALHRKGDLIDLGSESLQTFSHQKDDHFGALFGDLYAPLFAILHDPLGDPSSTQRGGGKESSSLFDKFSYGVFCIDFFPFIEKKKVGGWIGALYVGLVMCELGRKKERGFRFYEEEFFFADQGEFSRSEEGLGERFFPKMGDIELLLLCREER